MGGWVGGWVGQVTRGAVARGAVVHASLVASMEGCEVESSSTSSLCTSRVRNCWHATTARMSSQVRRKTELSHGPMKTRLPKVRLARV